jgi:hypothetical protein
MMATGWLSRQDQRNVSLPRIGRPWNNLRIIFLARRKSRLILWAWVLPEPQKDPSNFLSVLFDLFQVAPFKQEVQGQSCAWAARLRQRGFSRSSCAAGFLQAMIFIFLSAAHW